MLDFNFDTLKLILILLLFILLAFYGFNNYDLGTQEIISGESRTALDFVFTEIEQNYLNLQYKEDKFNFSWQDKYLEARAQWEKSKSPREDFMILGKMISTLKDGHIRLRPRENHEQELFREHQYEELLDIRMIEGTPLIISAPRELGITGYELVALEKKNFNELLDNAVKTWGRGGNEAQAKERLLQKEKHYQQYQLETGNLPESLTLTVKKEGKIRQVELKESIARENFEKDTLIPLNQGLYFQDESIVFDYSPEKEIGILRVNDFNLHPIELKNSLDDWLNEVQDKRGLNGVILDLRYNSGGNESFRTLLEYLITEPKIVGYYRYRYSDKFKKFHQFRALNDLISGRRSIKPAGENYSGYWSWQIYPEEEQTLSEVPIVILANSATFSAGDIFVRMALSHNLGIVIGEELVFSGHGLTEYQKTPEGKFELGFGLQELRDENWQIVENKTSSPDIEVELTKEAVREGRDNQLQKGLTILEEAREE